MYAQRHGYLLCIINSSLSPVTLEGERSLGFGKLHNTPWLEPQELSYGDDSMFGVCIK